MANKECYDVDDTLIVHIFLQVALTIPISSEPRERLFVRATRPVYNRI